MVGWFFKTAKVFKKVGSHTAVAFIIGYKFLYALVGLFILIIWIKTHNSESRGQEEPATTEWVIY